ncbi:hypothetical protein R1flu_020370 [Riccia fluitans]|uniref:Helicase C-terminal domain-containing protein n=1 Tax=Riccia fluitans TaxID=41844 RepID=A0ABD1ZLS2_9MARC
MAAEVSAADPANVSRDGIRHYYVAVDRVQFKMGTLVDLLKVLGRRAGLPLAICVGARDSLDAVYATVAGCDQFSVSFLHSDLGEIERAQALENFQLAMSQWNYDNIEQTEREKALEIEARTFRSQVLVMTDVCLPSPAFGESPLLARVMINYDLPLKKEIYYRRMVACFGSPAFSSSTGGFSSGLFAGGLVINVMTGGEVSVLRSIEESSGIVIDEMPINVSELV